jgi:hypothetical protein
MRGGWEVADGVDASVDPDQAAESQAVLDDIDRQPRIEELRAREDTVLAGGDLGDGPIDGGCGQLSATIPVK